MICVNCFHDSTSITNSRPHKKQASVWRRRQCDRCKQVFTTIERPSLMENKRIFLDNSKTEPFSLSRLTVSIAQSFSHNPHKAAYDAMWLAQTTEQALSTSNATITAEDIAATTHQVLKNYDELAAVQYAAKHQLIASTRRRGRPSLSPVERERPTDASPSR